MVCECKFNSHICTCTGIGQDDCLHGCNFLKKAAGQSIQAPLHGHLFFYDQIVIDEYVESVASVPGLPHYAIYYSVI